MTYDRAMIVADTTKRRTSVAEMRIDSATVDTVVMAWDENEGISVGVCVRVGAFVSVGVEADVAAVVRGFVSAAEDRDHESVHLRVRSSGTKEGGNGALWRYVYAHPRAPKATGH